MCHCNSPYCEISSDDEAFTWATTKHGQLMSDPQWIQQYPKYEVREEAVAQEVWERVQKQFPNRTLRPESSAREFRANFLRAHNTSR